MRSLAQITALFAAFPAWADRFERPIPQAQSATAEIWFAAGALALIAALIAVQQLVSRR